MVNFTKYKARKVNKNFWNPLKLPRVLMDDVLKTSLHEFMSTRVDHSGLPEVDYSRQ